MSNATLTPPATSRKIYENPVFGDKAVFLETSRETGGAYTLLEVEVMPGGGNGLHVHSITAETFSPLEGNLTVQSGNEKRILQPGESLTVPVNTKHCFRNQTDKPVKFLVKLVPGHEGFEQSLKIAYGLAADGLTNKESVPKNFAHMALLITMSDTNPTGIYSMLMPIFRWKARQARKRGVEQELINKYCR